MDEFWVCEHCRSLNRVKAGKCYSCKTPRGGLPAQPPAAPKAGGAANPGGEPPYRPTPLPGPPLPPGAGSQPFAQQMPSRPPATPPAPPPGPVRPPSSPPPSYAPAPPLRTTFGQSTVPFSGYPSTVPPPPGSPPPAGPQPSFGQFGSPAGAPGAPVPPSVAWAPQAAAPRSNTKALSVILGLALVVIVAAAAIIVVAPGLTKSSGTSFVAAATVSPTPEITPSPTPEITPSPTPKPTPTPRPSLAAAPAPKGYQQIVSAELDYAISFPSGWVSVSEEDPQPIADQIASLKKAYPSLAPLIDSETATLGEEYRITLFDPAAASSRKMMVGLFAVTDAVPPEDLTAGQAALKSELNSLGTVTGLTITSIKEPAGATLKAVGGMTASGVPVKIVMYMIAAKNHAFVLVFVTTSAAYGAYAKTYDAIAATIQEPPLP